jgi:hypothetical protein
MFRQDGGKKAIDTLEYLLKYDISENSLHQSAAMLAQLQQVSVNQFCNKSGYFVFDVVNHLLSVRGMKCQVIKNQNVWQMQEKSLQDNPAVVGIIDTVNLNSFQINSDNKWISLDPLQTLGDIQNAVVVLKMWQPVSSYYNNNQNFYITTDTSDLRYEHLHNSSWKTNQISYQNLTQTLKNELKKHRQRPIMMSNSDEIVILSPKKKGWGSETLLNYRCSRPLAYANRKIAEQLADIVVDHINSTFSDGNDGKGWEVLSHALFSCLQHLNGKLADNFCAQNGNIAEAESVSSEADKDSDDI